MQSTKYHEYINERTPFICFILSGFSSLVDQIVWLRIAFAKFGIITPVVSVVLSVFMAGLALGTIVAGKYIQRICTEMKVTPLLVYSVVEFLIGCGAILTPILFGVLSQWIFVTGEMDSVAYLASSAVMIAVSLFPWCFLMGTTFPVMSAHLRYEDPENTTSFSYLYLANVLGAVLGVTLSAGVLIELLGFHKTLWVSALSNWAIVALCISKGIKSFDLKNILFTRQQVFSANEREINKQASWVLFVTGFCAMGMEVAWTRTFTPITKTTIYAFAFLLVTYLIATTTGSFLYRRAVARQASLSVSDLLPWIAISSFLPLILGDPRLAPTIVTIVVSIFPVACLLGYVTPYLIDSCSKGDPRVVGTAYAINIAGCILGPLIAGYLLLPVLGLKLTIITLSVPLCVIALMTSLHGERKSVGRYIIMLLVIATAIGSFLFMTYEDKAIEDGSLVKRDFVATVVSSGKGREKQLLVNGYGMTVLTPVCKYMAHFPLAIMPQAPTNVLTICFGMGTAFRSLTTWGIDTTAVELVPGVKKSFAYYHDDAKDVLARPHTRVVIDDGRRFLERTPNKYDAIIIDPPPPVEAAGSSLLYSKEFCRVLSKHLTDQGYLMHWYPGGELSILLAITQSICAEFPYVKVFHSAEGWGYHILAANHPIDDLDPAAMEARMPIAARRDLTEWCAGHSPQEVFSAMKLNEIPINNILDPARQWGIPALSDDVPYNEYFALRRYLNPNAQLTQEIK